MRPVRQEIGGLGNLMFKQAYLWSQLRDGKIPDLYVQGEKYFDKYKDEIRSMFSFGIGNKNLPYVAVHIRRGDYMKAEQFHTALWRTDYYQRALAMFPDSNFMVFCKDNQDPDTDKADREWASEFIKSLVGDRFIMAPDESSETEDLNLMASCESLIMANSTFSWWAAYLGNHREVICPTQWFTDGEQRIDLLDKWTKI